MVKLSTNQCCKFIKIDSTCTCTVNQSSPCDHSYSCNTLRFCLDQMLQGVLKLLYISNLQSFPCILERFQLHETLQHLFDSARTCMCAAVTIAECRGGSGEQVVKTCMPWMWNSYVLTYILCVMNILRITDMCTMNILKFTNMYTMNILKSTDMHAVNILEDYTNN